jgi:16S rRNA G527 N7-methylase RsmG
MRMIGAKCNHLQMVDAGTKVGFPNAKVEELVEINETILLTGSDQIDDMIERGIEDSIPLFINRSWR